MPYGSIGSVLFSFAVFILIYFLCLFGIEKFDLHRLCTVIYFYSKTSQMHGTMNVRSVDAKQANEIYQYKNIKGKLYKTNAAI